MIYFVLLARVTLLGSVDGVFGKQVRHLRKGLNNRNQCIYYDPWDLTLVLRAQYFYMGGVCGQSFLECCCHLKTTNKFKEARAEVLL